ncbi:MFS transporter [uncultured Thermanaerothrix sp.]|uniref:MFS transporter n=1 Tax=uncultured Thermanaerothrix sp. TaxID=1195149 RepID=UPI0026042EF8|nr:MFS transporter [uncultured Thermanaerothrix sp.]
MEKEQHHRRAIWAWTMYDWANSAFATTIMAAVLPVYYASVAAADLPPNEATSNWAFTTTVALVLVAVLGPVLGAMADFSGAKKRFLTLFAWMGILGTALLYFVQRGDWLMASLFYILGSIGFSGANVFYDSLLPHVATPDEIDQVSSRGYAMGYAGGGILLAANMAMILFGPKVLPSLLPGLSLDEATLTALMTRLAFVTVAVWWFTFTIPLWRFVPEPPRRILSNETGFNPIKASFSRLANTFRNIRQYRELMKFIVAFWLYNNGIGTIIYMATIYGTELGFGIETTVGTLLMVQFVAIPFAILFGWLAKKIGTKPAILLSLAIYTTIAIGGYFLRTPLHFFLLGFAVATVQGGSQALSRSLFGRMVPKSQSAEFYSFFGVSEKIAGTVGPLVFGIVSRLMGGSRFSIISLIIFFALGMLLLTRVNEHAGIQVAEAEEQIFLAQAPVTGS